MIYVIRGNCLKELIKGIVTVKGRRKIDRENRFLAFKNSASFTSCISKINNTLTDNAEDLDIVIPIYSLLQYRKSYSKTSGSLWNYYKDELNNPPANDYVRKQYYRKNY